MKLIEIIIILSIVSIFSLAGFSSYSRYEQKKEFENAVQQFIGIIDFTKKMSIIRGETLYLCSSQNQKECDTTWHGPFVVFSSTDPTEIQNVIQIFPTLPSRVTLHVISEKGPALYFMPDSEGANNATLTFTNSQQQKTFALSLYGVLTETNSQ